MVLTIDTPLVCPILGIDITMQPAAVPSVMLEHSSVSPVGKLHRIKCIDTVKLIDLITRRSFLHYHPGDRCGWRSFRRPALPLSGATVSNFQLVAAKGTRFDSVFQG